MKNARGALGRYGEELAARLLTDAGMAVVERNWRCRAGEIDIVARDGDALVVCEVKTRRSVVYQHPMAAITPTKAERLRRLAELWLDAHGGRRGRRPHRPRRGDRAPAGRSRHGARTGVA